MYTKDNENESSKLVEIREESQKMEHWRIKASNRTKTYVI
jgi:hypothetical protein